MGEKIVPPSRKFEKDVPKPRQTENSLKRDSSKANHQQTAPSGDGFKDRGRTRVPDARHQSLRWSPQKPHVHFQANLLATL